MPMLCTYKSKTKKKNSKRQQSKNNDNKKKLPTYYVKIKFLNELHCMLKCKDRDASSSSYKNIMTFPFLFHINRII